MFGKIFKAKSRFRENCRVSIPLQKNQMKQIWYSSFRWPAPESSSSSFRLSATWINRLSSIQNALPAVVSVLAKVEEDASALTLNLHAVANSNTHYRHSNNKTGKSSMQPKLYYQRIKSKRVFSGELYHVLKSAYATMSLVPKQKRLSKFSVSCTMVWYNQFQVKGYTWCTLMSQQDTAYKFAWVKLRKEKGKGLLFHFSPKNELDNFVLRLCAKRDNLQNKKIPQTQ